jgi:hypothetical protein
MGAVTDHSHMGQSAHPGRRTGWSSALVATALAAGGIGLTGCSSSVASATTALRGVLATTVIHTDGSTVPAAAGMHLDAGDVVRTGAGGRAELVTQDRVVYVGSRAAMQVLDGAHQQLRHGAAVVDAQRGPGLALQVAGLSVDVGGGSAVRAERSVTVRIGTLQGQVDVESPTGRHLTIDALHQAMVGADTLPDLTTPLQLTDDDGEARTVPDLVRDDQTLIGLARGMDSSGGSTARVVSAASLVRLVRKPLGTGRSERLLPAVIAAAGSTDGVHSRYADALRYRNAGGSWGVVAHLVGVSANNVVTALDAFERSHPGAGGASVAAVLQTANGGRTPTGPVGNGNGGGTPNGDGNGNGNGGQPSGSPTPSPSPSDSSLAGTVQDTVDRVLTLVPTPSPTKTGSTPKPIITLPGLPRLP